MGVGCTCGLWVTLIPWASYSIIIKDMCAITMGRSWEHNYKKMIWLEFLKNNIKSVSTHFVNNYIVRNNYIEAGLLKYMQQITNHPSWRILHFFLSAKVCTPPSIIYRWPSFPQDTHKHTRVRGLKNDPLRYSWRDEYGRHLMVSPCSIFTSG